LKDFLGQPNILRTGIVGFFFLLIERDKNTEQWPEEYKTGDRIVIIRAIRGKQKEKIQKCLKKMEPNNDYMYVFTVYSGHMYHTYSNMG
jgi:hypothetical protein